MHSTSSTRSLSPYTPIPRTRQIVRLCHSCCETFSQAECIRALSADREFIDVWVSCELRKALEKGYLVTNVSEIWQFRITRFDPYTRQGGLFDEYIYNSFIYIIVFRN